MGSLADPTPPNLKGTIDLDVIDMYKILESWIDLYSPHLLYQLYYPAAAAINWNELTGSEDEPDLVVLEKWLSERKREMDTMDEDAIAKLDEIALYAQLMKTIISSYGKSFVLSCCNLFHFPFS